MFAKLLRKRSITSIQEVKDLINGIDKFGLKPICVGIGTNYKTFNQFLASEDGVNYKGLSNSIIIELHDTKLRLTTKYGPELMKACTYIFDLNGNEQFTVSGLDTFTQFSRFWKIPKAKDYNFEKLNKYFDEESGKYICSTSPIIGFNKSEQNKDLFNCYEYDINSAYYYTLLSKVPDLNNPKFNTEVKFGQVGFILEDRLPMIIGEKNMAYTCDVVFDLIDSPPGIIDYYNKWYSIKKNADNPGDKIKAKAYLNLPIGYCQRYNPFLRAYVVNSCNRVISNLLNSVGRNNCLIWNTDAIITSIPIDDKLELGNGIGQFKKLTCKTFRYIGNNYQIDDDIPTYRGIPKEWFVSFERKHGRKFNLLIDNIPERCNKYIWDWRTFTIKEEKFNG